MIQDGIHALPRPERIHPSAKKLRDVYAITPEAPFFHKTFGLWFCLPVWYENGLDQNTNIDEFFMFDPPGVHELMELGWCEAAFLPRFEEKIIEDRGDYEIAQDFAGRHILYFKGRRQGFMPEYLTHPVRDWKTWETDVKWRMNPHSQERFAGLEDRMRTAIEMAGQGYMMQQRIVGAYMYLRSLIGPLELLYFFHDKPDLIHECMRAWLVLADAVTAKHQQYVTFDEVFFGEDICYNHGSLISPDMIREFLFPYYQQLIRNIKSRQIDKTRHLYVQVDTDGYSVPVIDLYREAVGLDAMCPFEVASGCDVVRTGKDYPDLVISGGIDKRILAQDRQAIDRHLDYILPAMWKRGGYIPTCDHGVPEEVTWENYLHYRKRCVEFGR
ncbi:MAG: uroporphyrinogen decarboxylase family protein [Candidatus Zhuqueibacterota bacterium]